MKTLFVRCFLRLLTASALVATFYLLGAGNVLADPLDDWLTTTATFPQGNPSFAYGNGRFVAVSGTSLEASPDGANWTKYISPPVLNYNGIIFGDGVFMTFGSSITNWPPYYILQSSDGLHWTNVYESDTAFQITGGAYGNNEVVFVGDANFGGDIIVATLNPLQWYEFPLGNDVYSFNGMTYGDGQFVATANPSTILSSADGVLWQYDYTTSYDLGSIAYGNGMFVAACETNDSSGNYGYGFLVSSNLEFWQYVQLDSSTNEYNPPGDIAFGGGNFIAAVYNGSTFNTYTSTDGFNWVNRAGANGATAFAFGNGFFLADPLVGPLLQSGVFAPLTNSPSSLAIAAYPGVTVNGTVGATYQIQFSTNLNSGWLALTNISLPYSPYLWVDTSAPISGQRFYRSVQLQ